MAMESKTTSKTSSLKALLLRAWRERWTDLQWGINIKTVLPRGVSGDVYNLADCILQQAVVGAGANQLVLSYLRHSLSSQLVSHAAVLQRLSKYNQFNKVYCVTSLLEFLEGMLPGVTCFGKPEETVLATAVLSTALWLLNILHNCKDATSLFQKAGELLKVLLTDDFYVSMICLAKYNDPELFQETNRKCTELLTVLSETEELVKYVTILESIDIHMLCLPVKSEKWPGSLIQCWLEVKLTGDPGADTSTLADQLQIFQKLKGFSDSRLFAELIRGSFLALYNGNQTPHESQWGAFTFLKVPHILQEMPGKHDSTCIVKAIELLLQHSPLLDAMDANSSCSSLKCLLDELAKLRLINESQVKELLEKRKVPTTLKLDSSPSTGIPKVIICAESTLSGILKTLSTDYHKIQDAILGMLHQVLTGKSFELILAVACSSGQLKALVTRLIRFNECSKMGQDKARMQLFDISFVMLISIVQNYGASAVLDPNGESLIDQWVHECMVDRHKPKASTQLLSMCDPVIVESLIQQFNSGDNDLKPNMKLKDILFNMPGVMHEVLVAWEQGALAPSDVKRILDAVRGKMCCLPIAAATYLCSYMRTAPQETLLKPINMVQQLLATPATEEDSLRDRWQLTCEIIRKMQRDIQLPTTKSTHHLVSRSPATEWLHSTWNCGITKGWLDHNSARILHCLLDTAGPRWLVNAVIQELLKLRYKDQLQRGVDLALAIFHVDIVACTTELLSHILPQLLYVDVQSYTLMEPQLSSLAYLTCYCVYTAWDFVAEERDEEPPQKMPRLDNPEQQTPDTPAKRLVCSLLQLLFMFEKMQEGGITPQTYFIFNLIKALVEVKIQSANSILTYIPPSLISDLLKTLPDLFSYSMLLHLHDVCSTSGRINMAKDICILRNYKLRSVNNILTR
ncbi:mediator of RNA polymerase II transcription subunit 24 [Anthonomus grandis grandis]|uniref:mediator of RNA polymerase II transcription subunit 24 n=1 Tax=Anthonomus grandis grandis TaxID=2921223 RepID=UPI0021659F87|nr:mediator of RNA polymerase II transcription subunit 24 [Anthonomus grandis grandis]